MSPKYNFKNNNMSQFQVAPPEKFTFRAEDRRKWINHFESFRIKSGLETLADKNQVNPLIYAIGDEAEDILVSLHLTAQEASECLARMSYLNG